MNRIAKGLVLGIGGMALVAVAGCGVVNTASAPTLVATATPSVATGAVTPAATLAATAVAAQVKTYRVGDTLKLPDDVQLTITGAKASAKLPGFPQLPKTGDEFIVVSATATNVGARTDASVNRLFFTVRDSAGASVKPTMAYAGHDLSSSAILPGDQTAGEVVFEVPAHVAYRLYYQSWWWVAAFDLGTM